MNIKTLALQQYRNITKSTLSFDNQICVFVGNNGQGKTNLVESLVFLATGRSFRVNDDKLLVEHGKEFASIEALLDSGKTLKVVISNQGKYLQVDRKVVKKLSDFVGICNVILFSPDDLNFFSDSRRRRRHDVDLELGKISKDYMRLLTEYNRLLIERNACLKQSSVDDVYLEILTNSIIEKSIPIIEQRIAFMRRLEPYINKIYSYLTQDTSHINISYIGPINNQSVEFDALYEKYKDNLIKDLSFKATQVGIHRDDFIFKIDGVPVLNVASQGQKRMLMLSFKLALLFLIKDKTGSFPILCLDDLFSELDATRRKRVLEILPKDVQVFITTTDIAFINTERPVQIMNVSKGIVSLDREVQYVN